MKKTWILIILLSTLLILASCGGGGGGSSDDDDDNIGDLAALDISGAKSVFISSNSNVNTLYSLGLGSIQKSSSDQEENSLWKILENNSIQKVNMLDKNKKKISLHYCGDDLVPVLISAVNDNFFAIAFMTESHYQNNISYIQQGWIYPQIAFLVRKSDGAIYKLKTIPSTLNLTVKVINNFNLFKTDGMGNMYYIGNDDGSNRGYIVKVNLSTFSSTAITPSTQDVQKFEVDDAGNILYSGTSTSFMDHISRIRSTAGEYNIFPFEWLPLTWHGLDGALYYIDGLNVKRLNPSTLESEIYGVLPDYPFRYGVNDNYYCFNFNNCTYSFGQGGLSEVYNSTATPRNIPYTGDVTDIPLYNCCYYATEDYLYIAGKDDFPNQNNSILVRVDPTTGTTKQILGNEYDVYSFVVSEQDGIIFNALRKSESKRIIGKVSTSGGVVNILDETNNAQITHMEQLK